MHLSRLLAASPAACLFITGGAAVDLSAADEPVVSSLQIRLYGYGKVDAIYETTDMQGGLPKWVSDSDDDDGNFYMTARQTRLGLALDGPSDDRFTTSGKIEMDFYGDGIDDSNKPRPRLRHAFVQLAMPEQGFTLLAGQTWDLISPEIPSSIAFGGGWWSGDIGFRRPQIRGSQTLDLDSWKLDLAAAITGNTGDMGAERPSIQARATARFPLMARNATVTLGGQSGVDENEAESYTLVLGWKVPVADGLTISGNAWTGQNMADYLGGVGQNGGDGNEVAAFGAWLQAGYSPDSLPWVFNAGYGFDDPDDADLAAGARDFNSTIWLNASYQLANGVQLAAEIDLYNTEYVDGEDRDSTRFQFATIYKF